MCYVSSTTGTIIPGTVQFMFPEKLAMIVYGGLKIYLGEKLLERVSKNLKRQISFRFLP